jgi:glycerol uptake facilitator protein
MSLGTVFISEFAGTAILLLFGCGVVANVALNKTKGLNGGFLLVNFGWAIGVFAGVYVAYRSGAHINPAVTLGILANGAEEYAPDVEVTLASTLVYIALSSWAPSSVPCSRGRPTRATSTTRPSPSRCSACSRPAPPSATPWNTVTEVIGTFVLVFVILMFGNTPSGLGPLAAALLVLGIGNSLGWSHGICDQPGS